MLSNRNPFYIPPARIAPMVDARLVDILTRRTLTEAAALAGFLAFMGACLFFFLVFGDAPGFDTAATLALGN